MIQQDTERRAYDAVLSIPAGMLPSSIEFRIGTDVLEMVDLPVNPTSETNGIKYYKPARGNDLIRVAVYPNGQITVLATVYKAPFASLEDLQGLPAALVVTPQTGSAITVDLGSSVPEDVPDFAIWMGF